MELRRLISFGRAWLPLMVLAAVLAGAAAFLVSSVQQKVYEAKTTLIVGQALAAANPDYTQFLVAQNLSSTYAVVAKTRPVLEAVIKDLKLDIGPGDLNARVQVDAPRDSTLLTIAVQDTSPELAADLADALASELIASTPAIQGRDAAFQQSIEDDLAATQELIDTTQARADQLIAITDRSPAEEAQLQALEGRLASLRSTYATLLSFAPQAATNLLTVVEPAFAPTSPVLPRTLLNTLFGAALGLLFVFGLAFLREQLSDNVKDPDAVEAITGLSTLGTISAIKAPQGAGRFYHLVALLYPRAGVAEAYRTLRSNVEFASVDAPLGSILVTSAAPGEGKTVTAANLAVIFAQAGRTVLLVDADLRRPGVHEMFNLPNTHGLTTVLRDDTTSIDTVDHPTEQANLRVMTTGPIPPNPAELLGSLRMQALLERLRERADLIIFDSPPLQAVTDAAVISSWVDGTLLVIDVGRSRGRVVRRARETLSRAGAHVLGAVLNRVPARTQYGYGGDYGMYHATVDGAAPAGSGGPGAMTEPTRGVTGPE